MSQASGSDRRARLTGLAALALSLALLALATPLTGASSPASRVGWLLAVAAGVEALHALRRATAAARRQATVGALISLAIALFLINAPLVASEALRYVVAAWFTIDAVRDGLGSFRRETRAERWLAAAAALGNAAVALGLVLAHGWMLAWVVAIAGALRICGIAWNIMAAPVYTTAEADETIVSELGLTDQPGAAAIAAEVQASEQARAPIDRGWTVAFIATLFAIHAGRMSIDRTMLGLVSPAVAVLGDMLIAVLFTLLVINPAQLLWRSPTRWIERRVWRWQLTKQRAAGAAWMAAWINRLADAWLRMRMRYALRMREARYSIPAALNRGLTERASVRRHSGRDGTGLGNELVFRHGELGDRDVERVGGVAHGHLARSHDSLGPRAGRRTSPRPRSLPSSLPVWRQETSRSSSSATPAKGTPRSTCSAISCSTVANRPDVRFVVLSSDVVYPAGSMMDYEAKFWLPFKGVTVPVYAIPGNHDWYDALDAFAATFFEMGAARASIRARVEADLRVTSTTDNRIDELIREAGRLRAAYGVPTGFQQGPFFELQTDRFALIAVDTGILRSIDRAQGAWLDAALARASGKATMAILGHPFFAGGHDTTAGDETFARLKDLLRSRGVTVVMAGDTHDLEYYAEPGSATAPAVHYFVNGGGGAYPKLRCGARLAGAPPDG